MQDPDDIETEHLDDVEAGCGCAEIWETMSEQREDSAESGVADD